jgi:L-methionine (R)-S-oxide reductase
MVPIGSPEPVAALGAYWCAMVWLDPAALARIEALARQAGEALARVRCSSQTEAARAGRRRLTVNAS